MKAGELNRKITIQRPTVTTDADGFPTKAWANVAAVWAAIVTTGGGEFYAAQRVNSETTCLFKIRYRSDITPDMRIVYESRNYEILSRNDVDGKHVELLISAKEVA